MNNWALAATFKGSMYNFPNVYRKSYSLDLNFSNLTDFIDQTNRKNHPLHRKVLHWEGMTEICSSYKGDNFCNFLFAFLYNDPLLKRGLLLKVRRGTDSFFLEYNPFQARRQNNLDRVPSIGHVCISIKLSEELFHRNTAFVPSQSCSPLTLGYSLIQTIISLVQHKTKHCSVILWHNLYFTV